MNGRATSAIRYLLLICAGSFVILYVFVARNRIAYPFELEWMEGGSVDHVQRVLSGKPLYPAPSLEFTSYPYTPLYYWVCAVISRMTGAGFFPLRLVSFMASLGSMGVLFLMAKRETGSAWTGAIVAGLFAATFRIGGQWLDLARVDSLFLFFLLSGIYLLRFQESGREVAMAGIFLSLAFLTKQSAGPVLLLLLLYSLWADRKKGLLLGTLLAAIAGGVSLYLDIQSGGWFRYYSFSPGGPPKDWSVLASFWIHDLAFCIPIAILFAVLYLLAARRDASPTRFYFDCIVTFGMVVIAWSARLINGGFLNSLIPAYTQIALLAGLGLHRSLKQYTKPTAILLPVLFLLQFGMLIYTPRSVLPGAEDRVAGEKFIQTLSNIPGDVLIPYHGYYGVMAGKKPHAQIMTMINIVVSGDVEKSNRLVEEIRAAIRKQEFEAIVLDRDWFQKDVDEYYRPAGSAFEKPDVFWPVTGMRTRPERIYVRK